MLRARVLVASFLLAGGALPLGASPACAGPARAALVVDTGDSVIDLCIALPDEAVTGIRLIELAHEQHGLEYSLGFGGQAVCMLAGVGPTGEDCWEQHPYFWGYWKGGQGGWSWSSSGAGSSSVEAGDIEGWSWGSGNDGSSHPPPPPRDHGDVCRVAAVHPSGEKGRSEGRHLAREKGPEDAEATPAPRETDVSSPQTDSEPGSQQRRGRTGPSWERASPPSRPRVRTVLPSPSLVPVAAPSPDEDGGAGVPVLALIATAFLLGAGATVTFARRDRS